MKHQTCLLNITKPPHLYIMTGLDGEAAFPSVEREIQVRELYFAGERGNYLKYSKNTYENTNCHLKLNDKLSHKIAEHKGNRQGHVRASGHFKVYINPCLDTLDSSSLGFQLGPLCITTVCISDDTDSVSRLQSALEIVSHYGRRYHLKFNADKTKIVVTGSKLDMSYYSDTTPWKLVSGLDEEQKNVDQNIQHYRDSLFGLLCPAFSFRCMLSPTVKLHLWRTYNLPVLLSGLSSLPIRPTNFKSLELFQNKILRSFLKLSSSSPIPGLCFLFGELPVETQVHINTLCTFHNIWANPDTTIHKMVKYILMICGAKSVTWCNHLQLLCLRYSLPSPLHLMTNDRAWPK